MDTLQVIRDYLSEQHGLAPETITPESTLEEIHVDSLMFLELVFEFESRLGIPAPNEAVNNLKTVGDLIALVDKLKSEKQ